MREHKITVAVIALVLLALVGHLFVLQVRRTEVVVHYRGGRVLRVLNKDAENTDESGWYFRLPPPIDTVRRFDRRVRVLEGTLTETQLKDDWQVIISMYGAWRISDPVSFVQRLEGDENKAERNLKEIIRNETSQVIGTVKFDEMVNTDKEYLRVEEICQDITDRVREALERERYGLSLVAFGTLRTAIPEETTVKVFDRMNKERDKVAQNYRSQGERESKRIIAEAQTEAQKRLAEAQAEATQLRSEGDEAEAQYYDVFARAPELATFLRGLEALRTIAASARESGSPITFVLDPETPPFTFLRGWTEAEGEAKAETKAEGDAGTEAKLAAESE